MSEVSDNASVRLLIADYASNDAAKKLNVIGGGLSLISFDPGAGLTTPFTVIVSVTVPPKLYETEASIEMLLEDSAGGLVSVPGPSGEAQAIRIGQAVTFEKPVFAGAYVPNGVVDSRAQFVLTFNSGLPIAPGQRYLWRVRIDTESKTERTEALSVPGPAPAPVLG